MKVKKSTIVPILLFVYLCVMAYIGYPEYHNGHFSAFHYFGVIIATIAIIILLHFSLKRHERIRQERKRLDEDNN